MKKVFLSLVLILSTSVTFSQNVKVQALNNYAPNEIIVKLKDDTNMGIVYRSRAKGISQSTSQKDISALLGISDKVESTEVLFSEEFVEKSIQLKRERQLRQARLQNSNPNALVVSTEPEYASLKNIYRIKLKEDVLNIQGLAADLASRENVEYAEPNYIFSVNDFTIDSEIIYDEELSAFEEEVTLNDPLYSQQSNITQANIDDVWDAYGTGNGSQIVAILDTGVDYTHPDLEDNIWINTAELNGVEGYDDDGNGYVDDIRGWDFINLDNAPLDDNMHGTHVAGIIGAVGNNGIGISGAVWNVKLMPIKVFQSNGTGNSATIASGVEYATNNGATIQNMSFGSYAESSTLKAALETAYDTSVLVAAAGNNKVCIGPGIGCAPMYPGAYTYVLGVEDSNGDYDNYDQDGPIFSRYSNFLNYEVKAAGSAIMSTVPEGGYRALTGTSMATPLVAGAVALYNQQKPNDSKELLFGNLINTSGSGIDIKAAIDVTPTPLLKVLGADASDVIEGQNGNEFLEPGETINIIPTIKNYWGPTDDVRIGIGFWEFEDETKAEILISEAQIGSISAYGNLKQPDSPLQIKLAENIADEVVIKFELQVWSGENQEYLTSHELQIKVTNAIILDGYVEEDMVLTKENRYIFEKNLVLTNSSTLTILPGVKIDMKDNRITVDSDGSKVIANGNKDNFIEIYSSTGLWNGIQDNSNRLSEYSFLSIKNIDISDNYLFWITNSVIIDSHDQHGRISSVQLTKSNVISTYTPWGAIKWNPLSSVNEGVVYSKIRPWSIIFQDSHNYLAEIPQANFNNLINSSYLELIGAPYSVNRPLLVAPDVIGTQDLSGSIYFGTSSESILSKWSKHFYNSDATIGKIDFTSMTKEPSDVPHGHVWKVLVNGKDALDEYDEMDPIGVGTHEFKVYFNRAMDTSVDPTISYGVREPYVQKQITEAGTWSEDGKIYTVSHDINIGAADGINRIRVEGAKDLDNFYIPVEDYRFNFLLQSAGSASTGFAATPGLGEIDLSWEAPSGDLVHDVLGYNMYRYVSDGEGGFTDPVKVNENLITDVTFKDFDVVRDTQYFYKYKILRTSFEETDYSNAVSASLLTAALGDSNGDAAVNVLDVVNTVNYILGTNPTPFIDYATDVNNDSAINVLDIVAIVDLILNASTSNVRVGGAPINYYPNKAKAKAKLYWDGKDLIIDTPKAIAGLQLAYNTAQNYELGALLQGFESLSFTQDDQQRLMLYNMSQNVIPSGKHVLLSLTSGEPFEVINAIAGEVNGTPITLSYNENDMEEVMDAPYQPEELQIASYSPNPTYGEVQVKYYLPKAMSGLAILIYDAQGNLILNHNQLENSPGYHLTSFDLSKNKSGIYFMIITGYNQDARRYIDQAKIILK